MKRIKKRIKRFSYCIEKLSKKLGKTPTLIYLFVYLFLIFIFSLLYYFFLPGRHFYHPTVQYEYKYFDQDANQILEIVRGEIIEIFMNEYGTPQTALDGWQVDIEEVGVYSLFVEDFPNEIQFDVSLPITYTLDDGNQIWSRLFSKVKVPLKSRVTSGETVLFFVEFLDSSTMVIKGVPNLPSPEMLFPYWEEDGVTTYQAVLPISPELYESIIEFGQGYKGFPSGVSGHYLRMLYFSTGVATSTALGDIVPVTNQARFWVTGESIFAIIIVTLLLNSIAHDIGKSVKNLDDDNHDD